MIDKRTVEFIVGVVVLAGLNAKMAEADLELAVDWDALEKKARAVAEIERIDLAELDE